MQVVETWPDYVRRIAAGLTQAQIAEKIGVASSNVGRWLRGEPGMVRAETVIAFAKAFNEPPMEALVAAGYFSPDESAGQARTPLSQYSTDELFAELRRRTITD